MADLQDVKSLVVDQSKAIEQWKREQDARLFDLEKKINRPGALTWGQGKVGDAGSPEEYKALDRAFRCLISGDQGGADRALAEVKAMNTVSDPDGGYVNSPLISSTMTTVMLETAPILGKVRTVQMTHGTSFEEPVDRDSADASWVGEVDARPETDAPDLGKLVIPLNELFAMPSASQTLIDQADIDIVRWLTRKIAEQFAHKEADAIFNGDGIVQPRGLLTLSTAATADSTRAWGTVQYIASGKSAAFASVAPADKLIDVVHSMKQQYLPGAVWLMSRATAAAVRQLKDGQNNYLWQIGTTAGQPDTLYGFPVILCEEMPAIAADSFSVMFVNLERAFTRIERPGVKMLLDPFTDKPNVRLYSYRRVGGSPSNSEAVKVMKFSAS